MPLKKFINRSFLQGESVGLLRAAIKSNATLDPYERRLIRFLKAFNLPPDRFVGLGKSDHLIVEKKIIAFLSAEKSRAEKGEISSCTVNSSIKAAPILEDEINHFEQEFNHLQSLTVNLQIN